MRSDLELLTFLRDQLKKLKLDNCGFFIVDKEDRYKRYDHLYGLCDLVLTLPRIDLITNLEYWRLREILDNNRPNTKETRRHNKKWGIKSSEVSYYWWVTVRRTSAKKAKRPRIKYLNRLIKKYESFK